MAAMEQVGRAGLIAADADGDVALEQDFVGGFCGHGPGERDLGAGADGGEIGDGNGEVERGRQRGAGHSAAGEGEARTRQCCQSMRGNVPQRNGPRDTDARADFLPIAWRFQSKGTRRAVAAQRAKGSLDWCSDAESD